MTQFKVGDKVSIHPKGTRCPWTGDATGKVYCVDRDGTIAVELNGHKGVGHSCSAGGGDGKAKNGWWLSPKELKLIKEA